MSPGLFHFRAALDLLGQDWGGPPGHAEGGWDALVRRVRRALAAPSIISHEILAPATPEHDRAARCATSPTARCTSSTPPATWPGRLPAGLAGEHQAGPPVDATGRSSTQVRAAASRGSPAPSTCRPCSPRWGAGLPPERVHVVTVPQRRRPPATRDLLWQRFCTAFGIDPAWAPRDSDRANASLGSAETQVLRRLNQRIDRATRREAAYDELIREMLAQDQLVRRRLGAGPAAPRPLRLGRGARRSSGSTGSPAAGST